MFKLAGSESNLNETAENFGKLGDSESFADVIIHCRGQVPLRSSKIILAKFSRFLKKIFDLGDPWATVTDLICPDFDPEPVKEVLNLIHRGQSFVNSFEVYLSMKKVIRTLEINLELTEFRTMRKSKYVKRNDAMADLAMEGIRGFTTEELFKQYKKDFAFLTDNKDKSFVRVHTGDTYDCSFCDQTFPTSRILTRHIMDCLKISYDDIFNVRKDEDKGQEESTSSTKKIKLTEKKETKDLLSADEKNPEAEPKSDAKTEQEAEQDMAEFICGACNKKFTLLFALQKHMDTKHRPLNEISDSSETAPAPTRKRKSDEIEIIEDASKSNEEDGQTSVDISTNSSTCSYQDLFNFNEDGSPEFACKFCPYKSSSKGNLSIHICNAHFKAEILAVNGYNKEKCNSCGKRGTYLQSLVYHIGIGHGVLKKILAKEDPTETFFSTTTAKVRKASRK